MKELNVDELVDKLTRGERIQIIDIREKNEYADWQIPGSINCPAYNAIGMGDTSLLSDFTKTLSKNDPVVAVCRGGIRSQVASQVWEAGGLEVFNLVGGMGAWSLASTTVEIDDPGSELDKAFQIRRNGKGCLSYLLISDGEALVIDPSLPPKLYLNLAAENGAKIRKVVETHVHADHVSRGRALAMLTQSEYILPKNDRVTFKYNVIQSGDNLSFGRAKIKALSTPGHTGESTCYLSGNKLLFSGDTIFTDNVGRPDLEKGDSGAELGAHQLFRSLTEIVFSLPEAIRILPAHTAGSIGFDRKPVTSTLQQLKSKLAALVGNETEFVTQVVGRLSTKPGNFDAVIAVNEGKLDLAGENPAILEAGPNRCAAC